LAPLIRHPDWHGGESVANRWRIGGELVAKNGERQRKATQSKTAAFRSKPVRARGAKTR
jgi:hypothetical protein